MIRSHARLHSACARSQEAVWFAEQVGDVGGANNLPLSIAFDGPVDPRALESALNAVVRAHPALRTRFTVDGGRLLREELDAETAVISLAVEDVEDPAAVIAERSRSPLSLLDEPFTASLLRRRPDEQVLFANAHHSIFDGTSKEIFARDLAAALAGRGADLGEGGTYASYVAREQRSIETLHAHAAAYWEPRLRQLREAVQFPTSAHAAAERARGESLRFQLGPVEKGRLDLAAGRHGVSLFVLLMGAVQLFQHAYSGRSPDGVATLIPLGTRPEDMRDAIGMFVNEVPLYTQPAEDIRLGDYLQGVSSALRELSRLRLFPFNEAIARFGPGEDPQRLLPRFMVSYWKTGDEHPRVGDRRLTVDRLLPVYGRRWGARFRFLDAPERLLAALEYDSAVLHEAAAVRAIEHLRTLLDAMVTAPDARLSELSPLPMEERHLLVSVWNDTARQQPEKTLHELFEAQARRTPARAAVAFAGRELTYDALNRRANRLAWTLIESGAGPGAIVGIHVERGLELAVAVLAVLKSGAGYVPLDPAYPAGRIAFMLEDTGARIVVTQRGSPPHLSGDGRSVLLVDDAMGDAGQDAVVDPPPRALPDDVAYVIYTSGSTGTPKGTELVHSGVANLLWTLADEPGLDESDVFLSLTTLSFDIGSAELLAPLCVGGKVVIAPTQASTDPDALARLLAESGATITFGTPSRWRLAIAGGWKGGQTVLVGGEALEPEVARRLLERSDRVWNIYGPTETTIFSTRARVEDPDAISIGRPVANTRLYVVDATGGLAPIGVAGELCIAGAGVARRYLNRPQLTAERFVPDPFGAPGARLYRTGDLVRYRDDGMLEFVGRVDDQVKIRGFRVEPGEIEVVLAQQPGVDRAAVVVDDDPAQGRRLVAYVVPAAACSAHELRTRLSRSLPDLMVPSAFVGLDELPLNLNGKLDRRRLPRPTYDGDDGHAQVPPRNRAEEVLVGIWERVLGVEPVGVTDNFFELGGHSLLAAEVVAQARDALRAEVPMGLIFGSPTVAEMAEGIAARGGPGAGRPRAARERWSR